MTTWLEFRSEPLSEVPEVEVEEVTPGKFIIRCHDETCKASDSGWSDATSEEVAEESKLWHVKWHEDGMSQ